MTGCPHNTRRNCTDCERNLRWPVTPTDPELGLPRVTTWHDLRLVMPPAQYKIAAGMYSAHPEYALHLHELAQDHGMVLAEPRLECVRRLVNPRHRCSSSTCWEDTVQRLRPLDHIVWFRSGTAQWALLSQEYATGPRVHESVPCPGGAICLPSSPYGCGTFATLYLGAARGQDAQEAMGG